MLVIYLYADDTTLFSTIEYSIPSSASNYHQTINLNLSKVTDWLIANRLSLNVKKNKYMLFHPYQKDITQVTPRLMLNNDEIERVDSFNFLGVTIDKHLNWKQHTEIIANKLSKYCGILFKLKNYLPIYIMRTLYFSMVQSHLNFGSLLWGYVCNRLIKLQKRIIRTISRSNYNAHTNPLFKELFILKLPDIVSLNALKIYYKCQKKCPPSILHHFWYSTPKLHSWSSYTTIQRYQNTQNTYQINREMLKKLSTHHYKFNSSLYPIEGQYTLHTRIFVCNKVPPTKCLWSWMCHSKLLCLSAPKITPITYNFLLWIT